MKFNYLEYSKLILLKVRFDQNLLAKEYRKALKWLDPNDRIQLRNWTKLKKLQVQPIDEK